MMLRVRGARVEAVERQRKERVERRLSWEDIQRRVEWLSAQGRIRLQQVFCDDEIHAMCDAMSFEFRERVFTPAKTLGLFVSQILSRRDACSTVVTALNRERRQQGLPPISDDASAYSKARSRRPLVLIHQLRHRLCEILHDRAQEDWKWNGLNVDLVDGFVLRAPDTRWNQDRYPQPSSQQAGLGFPQVRVVVTTSLADGSIVHYSTAPVSGRGTGEVSLFREKHRDFHSGDVIVADSNFESFHDAALLRSRGVHLVCCINGTRSSPFAGPCESINEQLVSVPRPKFHSSRLTRTQWTSLPGRIRYRVIRYQFAGMTSPLTIVTTLLDDQRYSAADIAELYGLRWDVEVDIRSFKTTLGLCELRCLTPDNLEREIAVGVLATNLVRVLMADTADVLQVHPREISFSAARDAWRLFHDQLTTMLDLAWITHAAAPRLVRNRPHRSEPRALKRRNAKYPRLQKPRPSHRCSTNKSPSNLPPPKNNFH